MTGLDGGRSGGDGAREAGEKAQPTAGSVGQALSTGYFSRAGAAPYFVYGSHGRPGFGHW
jgi:hypothetical protein